MANDTKRYINNIYVNGVPYACRDEELTAEVENVKLKIERDEVALKNHEAWLKACFNKTYKDNDDTTEQIFACDGLQGNVCWDKMINATKDRNNKEVYAPFPTFNVIQEPASKDYILLISLKSVSKSKGKWGTSYGTDGLKDILPVDINTGGND